MATLMIYINELRQYLRDVPHWVSNQSSTGKQDATKLNKHYSFYMPEASHFTEGCLQRWNHMKEEEIIRDGILNNSIPLVQCYLKQSSKSSGNLQHIIDIGFSQVYLALLERDLRNSARMLKSMGFNVTQQLRRICLYSPNVYLRDFLVEELKKSGDLTDIELSMVHFVYQLESLYTCRSYDKAKSIAEETKKHYWENIIRLSRIPTMQAKSVMSSLMKTGDIMPPDDMNAESGNYSHIVLEWVRDWDEETRQRILLDRMFNNTDRSFEGFIEPRTRWKYYLSHNLWNPISKWITADPDSICADMLNDMTLCTPYIKNKVLDEMARKGLFASEELSDFDRLLRRLGNCHQLLRHPHILSNNTTMNVEMFHSQFILYCIQHSLPNVLHYYMDFYGLAVTDDHISRLRSEHKSCYWFEMLLFFRYNSRKLGDPNIMFQASLANCRFLFKVNQPTVTSLLEADRPIAAMATLMFAPCNLNEVIGSAENEDERLWKVDGNLLKQSLQSYPKLQAALFPVQTADGITPQDITMYQLLQGNTQFDISKLFRWQSTNNISTPLTDKATELPHFSQPDLVNQYAHKEVLRYTYYLRKARPSFAFVAFVKNLQDTDPAVLKKRTKQAYYRVYTIALQELTQHSISAACVAFIEMLGQDSSALRIDLQSGNLMLRYKKDELTSDQRFDKSTREQKAQEIESNILSDLLSALKQKGSSAERLLRNLESAITGEIEKAAEESTSFAASQYWSLAVLFCQIHKLPYTTVYLEDCAKNDQWLRFLCFVQNHHYPQNQVIYKLFKLTYSTIVTFSNMWCPHIREHLQHAVENLQYIPDGKGHLSRNEEQAKRSKDLRAQYLKRVGIAKGDIGKKFLVYSTIFAC
uniref:Spatacsin-like n=1 Tax=Saccoglossus kowalevskii TaxID=10224 RepID=A0ABM0LV80_SACKO|nr:PREDICTED: spatacsin-like [Saccoglossus kowalevskii]